MATMNQLWAWEYEGKTEVGEQFKRGHDELCRTFNNKERYRLIVTNLRKVKMVDEDAITISKELWGWINSSDVAYGNGWRIGERISSENPQLNTIPPVTEPKNFGAIVEAETPSWANRRKFVKLMGVDDPIWFGEKEQSYFIWSDLINPIIISEGVEG